MRRIKANIGSPCSKSSLVEDRLLGNEESLHTTSLAGLGSRGFNRSLLSAHEEVKGLQSPGQYVDSARPRIDRVFK